MSVITHLQSKKRAPLGALFFYVLFRIRSSGRNPERTPAAFRDFLQSDQRENDFMSSVRSGLFDGGPAGALDAALTGGSPYD